MDIALWIVTVLAGVIAAISVLLVAGRLIADQRRRHHEDQRRQLKALVVAALPHAVGQRELLQRLASQPAAALAALVAVATEQPAARPMLAPLFRQLGFLAEALRAATHRRWDRRLLAASRLGLMAAPDAVPPLTALLEDEMLDVRIAASHALAQLGAVDAVVPILRALAMRGDASVKVAADALLDYGDVAVAPLIAFLRERTDGADLPAATVALTVLGLLAEPRAVDVLVRTLGDPAPELRINAARALGLVGGDAAVDALTHGLADAAWEVRSAIAQALGRIGDAKVVPQLGQLLTDRAWWVRCNAAIALDGLGPSGRALLHDVARDGTDAFARDISREVLDHPPAAKRAEVTA